MIVNDKVLETLLLDQTSKRPVLDKEGAEYTLDVFDDLDVLIKEIKPTYSFAQMKEVLDEVKERNEGREWDEFVFARALKPDCEDGRYLVTLSNSYGDIAVSERYGILDLKFKAIDEHVDKDNQWSAWAISALQSVFGYSDNGADVLLTRINILQDFIDHYIDHYHKEPDNTLKEKAAEIISWNVFQLENVIQSDCNIMDWNKNETIPFLAAYLIS